MLGTDGSKKGRPWDPLVLGMERSMGLEERVWVPLVEGTGSEGGFATVGPANPLKSHISWRTFCIIALISGSSLHLLWLSEEGVGRPEGSTEEERGFSEGRESLKETLDGRLGDRGASGPWELGLK